MMKRRAEDDLRARLMKVHEFHGNNTAALDIATAKHILEEDLGNLDLGYVEQMLPTYNLDDEARDRLIAHARRDAACAVFGLHALSREVRSLRQAVRFLIGVVIMLISVQVWAVVVG